MDGELDQLKRELLKYFTIPGVIKRSIHLFRTGELEEPYYIDVDLMLNDPSRCETIVFELAKQIEKITKERKIDLLGFIEKRGEGTTGLIRLAGAVSIKTGLPNFTIRLSRKISFEKVKVPITKGIVPSERLQCSKTLILTDYATTGGELLNAIGAVASNGGTVTDVIAYAARKDTSRDQEFALIGVKFHAIVTVPDELETMGIKLKG